MDGTLKKRFEIETEEHWDLLNAKIPFIKMDPGWTMRPLAPFGGAAARFAIQCGTANVSVYLDTKGRLGGDENHSYWEVYPHNEDVIRTDIDNVEELHKYIKESISQQLSDVELILENLKDE